MARENSESEAIHKTGEVCRIAGIQPYVLRYWESEFPALATGRIAGGARVYSSGELELVRRIKSLLYDEGYTIAGARKKLEGELAAFGADPLPDSAIRESQSIRSEPRVESPPRRKPRRAESSRGSIDTPRAAGLNAAAVEIADIAETLDQLVRSLTPDGEGSPNDRQ